MNRAITVGYAGKSTNAVPAESLLILAAIAAAGVYLAVRTPHNDIGKWMIFGSGGMAAISVYELTTGTQLGKEA